MTEGTLSAEELDRLEALWKASDRGEWIAGHFANDQHSCQCKSVLSDNYMGAICTVHADDEDGGEHNPTAAEAKAHLLFIAAMHNAFPALIAAARSLRLVEAERDELRAAMKEMALGWAEDRDRAIAAEAAIPKTDGPLLDRAVAAYLSIYGDTPADVNASELWDVTKGCTAVLAVCEAELSALKHDIGRHMDALLAAEEAREELRQALVHLDHDICHGIGDRGKWLADIADALKETSNG